MRMLGKRGGGEEHVSGLSLMLRLAARIAYVAAMVLVAAVLYVSLSAVAPSVAEAQVEDWDDVTEPEFDSASTDAANRQITEAQDARAAAEEEEAGLDCELCVEQRDIDEELEAADEETYEGTAELVDARAQAIEGAPGDSEGELEERLDALDTLESYAEEWSPEGENEGEADTAEVDAAREEVEGQLGEVEGSGGGSGDSSGGSDEESGGGSEDTAEETTSAPPAGGSGDSGSEGSSDSSGDGDDSGGSDGGSEEDSGGSGGPLSGLANAFDDFGLGTLIAAALIAVGIIYYVGGLLKEGLRERASKIGRPTQAQASAPKQKAKSAAGKSKPSPPKEKKPSPEKPSTPPEEPRIEGRDKPPDERSSGNDDTGGRDDKAALTERIKRNRRQPPPQSESQDNDTGDDSSADELNQLFSFDEGDEDEDEGGDTR